MDELLEFYRLTTILIGKLAYAAAAVISVALITERVKKEQK